jgi:arsenite oxidase small subunit
MKRCNAMVDAGRRKFLTGAGIVAAGAGASAVPVSDTKPAPAPARVIRWRAARTTALVGERLAPVGMKSSWDWT